MSLLTAKVHFVFIHIFYAFDLQFTRISWLWHELLHCLGARKLGGAYGPHGEPPQDGTAGGPALPACVPHGNAGHSS